VETSRAELVGRWLGETSQKVKAVFQAGGRYPKAYRDSELAEYFMCNKNLTITRVVGTKIEFIAHGYTDIFDIDAFETYVGNHNGYFYAGLSSAVTPTQMETLYMAIFSEGKYKLRICAAYTADMRTGLRAFSIFVYPQEVTGATVNTDQKTYTEWLYGLDDDTFSQIRMQAHSRVNMGVSSSGVDNKHRQQILDQLEPDMFYVFMIWNKSLTVHTLIYDMARNILYEDNDVSIKLIDDEGMDEFPADANKKVQKPTARATPTNKKNKGDWMPRWVYVPRF